MMMPVMTLLPGVKGEEAAGQRAAGASLCGRNSVKKKKEKRGRLEWEPVLRELAVQLRISPSGPTQPKGIQEERNDMILWKCLFVEVPPQNRPTGAPSRRRRTGVRRALLAAHAGDPQHTHERTLHHSRLTPTPVRPPTPWHIAELRSRRISRADMALFMVCLGGGGRAPRAFHSGVGRAGD